MINIVTNDSRLDLAVAEILGEIRNSQRLEGSFVAERIEKGLYVKKDADGGRIGYCDTRALLRAVSLLAEYADSEELDLREVPRYDTLGSMPDMSRNAVMKVESVKKLMRIGLKENVIIGKLIPAGTGLTKYQNTKIEQNIPIIASIDDYDSDIVAKNLDYIGSNVIPDAEEENI